MKIKIKVITLLSLLITLVLTNGIYADDTIYTNGNFKFILNDDETITIVEYFGKEDIAEIPMLIGGYPVVSISENTFGDTKIKEIKVPETIPVEEVQLAVGDKTQIDTFNRDNEVINTILPKQESIIQTDPIPLQEHEVTEKNDNNLVEDNDEIVDYEIVVDEKDISVDDNEFIEETDVEENIEEIEDEQSDTEEVVNEEAKTNSSIIITSIIIGLGIIIYIVFKIKKK